MAKRYGSFLLRRWRLPDGGERVEVQHIQTGERVVFASLKAALDWIAAQEDAPGVVSHGRVDPPARAADAEPGHTDG
ncbi:MAG TPA: hypothetical protein VJN88_02265 [Ktedonobacterales bacterium]|nr:hypothetical protein [Ktedonobacterales bacterium]